MSLTKLSVLGYRGFSKKQSMKFAKPTGQAGSGLTIITGTNNSGKSSVIECLRARTGYQNISFTVGKRNQSVDEVIIEYEINEKTETVKSLANGSSETQKIGVDQNFSIFVLPSRRAFEPYFHKSERGRDDYLNAHPLPPQRGSTLPEFASRLFKIVKDPSEFNRILEKALGYAPNWSIDQSDQGQHFLKFTNGGHTHSSDGLGEGIVSVFAIVDALYDSAPGSVVVIDEPELSLHPALQRRVSALLLEYAKDRQIIISTHSPYFVTLEALAEGAHIVRATNESLYGTLIHELSSTAKQKIKSLVKGNINNPHIFGLDAREIFFQEDGIILTEGQDDVLLYPEVAAQIGALMPAHFFGWGIGGASNMSTIATVLNDLGFKKVAGLLDKDKEGEIPALKSLFPEYFFATIPAKDIRTKKARDATPAVDGLLDEKRRIRPEYADQTKELFDSLGKFMKPS
ncbi:MAG TPA: AAA family ATPase [Bosea sp. (in: a-proteobacteria)]